MTTGQCPMCRQPWQCAAATLRGHLFATPRGTVHLSPTEAVITRAIIDHGMPKEQLLNVIYGGGKEPENSAKSLTTMLYYLKRKLATVGYAIINTALPGRGNAFYVLHPVEVVKKQKTPPNRPHT